MLEGLLIPIVGIIFFGGYTAYSLITNRSPLVLGMSGFFTLFWIRVLIKNMRNRNNSAE